MEKVRSVFAALASLCRWIYLTSALGQSAAHRLSVLFADSPRRYRHMLGRLVLAGAGIGLAGLVIVLLWGRDPADIFPRRIPSSPVSSPG
jgi:hypothetical protein